MATLHSEIILCNNIKLDKNYMNVLSYSQNDMLSLCRANQVAVDNDYSFIRENGAILVDFPYSTCLGANYMAYQNKDYTNKWFFAFIDKVEYVSEKSTRIFFKVDSWSTFYDDWSSNNIFVHREHVSSDTFGAHTLPENLETGEYINAEPVVSTSIGTDMSICVATSKKVNPQKQVSTPNGALLNDIYQGLQFAVFSDYPSYSGIKKKETAVNQYMYWFSHVSGLSTDDIIDIFMIPTSIIGSNYSTSEYQYDSGTLPFKVKFPGDSTSSMLLETYLIKDNKILANSYSPKNKKLLCFPYRYILASNGTGQDVVYKWEDFVHDNNDYITFKSKGDLTPNCSIKCIPQGYKGITDNLEEAINFSKYPTCSWIYDAYTNWQTQNNVNNSIRAISDLVKIGSAPITKNPASITEGATDIFNLGMEQYQHSFDANQARGNVNSGDINFTITKNEIQFYKMSIKPEYATIIDDIFNRFGYVVNSIKHPNITGRPYWNYVEVATGEKTVNGSIPQFYMDEINNIFIKGVTIWHNHSNIGNFALDNSI